MPYTRRPASRFGLLSSALVLKMQTLSTHNVSFSPEEDQCGSRFFPSVAGKEIQGHTCRRILSDSGKIYESALERLSDLRRHFPCTQLIGAFSAPTCTTPCVSSSIVWFSSISLKKPSFWGSGPTLEPLGTGGSTQSRALVLAAWPEGPVDLLGL